MVKTEKVDIIINDLDNETGKVSKSTYGIEVSQLTTVLDALILIKEKQDAKVSFRYSCRMAICGSCSMVINGKPSLACNTRVALLNSKTIEVAPLRGQPILRGLVSDFDDFFKKHKSVKPWIIHKDPAEKFSDDKVYKQSDEERDRYLPFSGCIKCGLCLDACPVVNTEKGFVGPQALAQAYRYNEDTRDAGKGARLDYLDTLNGIWGCEYAGACSEVCPKSVDPALAIQLLKFDSIMQSSKRGQKPAKPASVKK